MLRLFHQFLILCGLVTIGAGYSLFSGLATPPWAKAELAAGEIRRDDARSLDALWVDARPADAYAAAHYPQAYSLNPENWEQQLPGCIAAWLERPRPIIVYCHPLHCDTSREIAAQLRSNLPEAEIYSLLEGWAPTGGADN